MSAEATTLAGRAAAEALMVDACTIADASTLGPIDEDTSEYAVVPGTERYDGPCRIRVQAVQDSGVEAGERIIVLRSYIVSVPMSVDDVEVNDVVIITDSVLDSSLPGTVLRVQDIPRGTHLTARRLVCEEVQS